MPSGEAARELTVAKYKIVEPCAFLVGGKAVHHTEPGAVVELDDAEAKRLGDAVEPGVYVSPNLGGDFIEPFAVVAAAPARKSRRKSEPEGDDE